MRKVISLLFIFLFSFIISFAQTNETLIGEIQNLMSEYYIFPDKATETNAHLEQLMQEGYFDAYKTPNDLASALTEQMRKITKDKHLGVYPPRQARIGNNTKISFTRNLNRYYGPMFSGYQYFENNVGYLNMRFFGGASRHFAQVDEVMKQLTLADAIIIDVRNSQGGSPRMVQYLCSYFFEKHLLLSSIYSKHDNHTEEYWTVKVNGKKRSKVPVFILTSASSFSAAEDFPYTMQAHQRATIIGEVTRGGAHPTRSHNLANGFRIRIPFARSINPITKTNWEGVGIMPNIKVDADMALEKAKELANTAAKAYKKTLFQALDIALDNLENETTEKEVLQLLEELVKSGIIYENDINRAGYNYMSVKKIKAALAIFKANTLLFSNSANAHDSYAEGLAKINENDLALAYYKKAVTLAQEQQLENLDTYKQNLKAFEERLNIKSKD